MELSLAVGGSRMRLGTGGGAAPIVADCWYKEGSNMQGFWRSRVSTALAIVLAAIAVASAVGAVQASGDGESRGEGHTPVTICHWVPAHGGSFIVITIDDDGLHGHSNHENDIIPAPSEGCPGAAAGDETAVPTKTFVHKTEAPRTKTVVVTQTAAPSTVTPVATNTNTPVATATATVGNGVGPGPDLTPEATDTSVPEATDTPGGGVGVDTATPDVDTPTATNTVGAGGGVGGVQVTPEAGGAEALPSAGSGGGANSGFTYGFAALSFAAMAGATMLVLGRKLHR